MCVPLAANSSDDCEKAGDATMSAEAALRRVGVTFCEDIIVLFAS